MSRKDTLKRFAAEYPPLEWSMYWYYRLLNGQKARREIARRAEASLFDYPLLSSELPYFPEERVIDNNIYGYAHYLKKYAGIEHDLKAYMEHGLFLGGIVHKDQYHWHFPKVITMSRKREEILATKLPSRKSIAVGPYIHYATPLLNQQEMKELKKTLGRVLLVFPFHSMKSVKVKFDEEVFLKEIDLRAANFDTVLICMYYVDCRDEERIYPYQSRGYKIVTAGHKFDPNFVARQKAHIELSDMTMSNGMGTQTGFCTYLKKPHYIFRQEIAQNADSAKELLRFINSSDRTEKEQVRYERELFSSLFCTYQEEISPQQYQLTAEYWGFKDIKSPAELREFF